MPDLPMTEAQLQATVLGICRWAGVLAYHTHDSRRSQPGYPDLTIAGLHGLLFRELKTARGKVSKAQAMWGAMLREGGADWAVWRPADLWDGRVQREVQAIR